MATKEPENVKAIYDGQIENIIMVGDNDFGFGNTIIIKHQFNDQILYSLYAHLEAINKDILIGQKVNGGTILGKTGASGYGCQNY
jgi:murein DD-endopeptidase MepM/ murein hydrolase activator NlpD